MLPCGLDCLAVITSCTGRTSKSRYDSWSIWCSQSSTRVSKSSLEHRQLDLRYALNRVPLAQHSHFIQYMRDEAGFGENESKKRFHDGVDKTR